jgi:murein DD-endopeptidase MepM/ murein hydrolase activator NlpD
VRVVWPLPPGPEVNRIDAGFLDPQYPKWRKQMGLPPDEHPGIDINLSGTSGDADLRYPVVAVAPGKVIHAGRHRVWGNIVLVEHPTLAAALGYPYLATQYAHLNDILVKEGQVVYAGEPVGTIGKGDPARPFYAHLHFEVRVAELPPDYWPKTKDRIARDYLDPASFLKKHADYRHRYIFTRHIVYPTEGSWAVVNIDDLYTVHLRPVPPKRVE